MPTFLHLVDLVTSDTLTLAATGILAVAVLALLVLIAWPSSTEHPGTGRTRAHGGRPAARGPRTSTAKSLAASGLAPAEIARRTGLSRDALALLGGMSGLATSTTRQKAPASAGLALFGRILGQRAERGSDGQVPA